MSDEVTWRNDDTENQSSDKCLSENQICDRNDIQGDSKRMLRERNIFRRPEWFSYENYENEVVCASDDTISWKNAMDEEIMSLENNHTWNLMPLQPNRKTIKCKWVYKLRKENLMARLPDSKHAFVRVCVLSEGGDRLFWNICTSCSVWLNTNTTCNNNSSEPGNSAFQREDCFPQWCFRGRVLYEPTTWISN